MNTRCATFGEYAIHPRYRRFGIGCALWNRCIDHCSTRNCAILANAKNVNKYREKSGFTVLPARKLLQFCGYPQVFMLNKYHEQCDFEWINGQFSINSYNNNDNFILPFFIILAFNLADVVAYDEQITGFNRSLFIEYSNAESSSIGTMARCIESGKVLGYGIFRRANRSTIVPQPLYANCLEIAEVLLYNALQRFTGYDKLAMECWDINHDATLALAKDKLGLQQVKTGSTIMFTEFDMGANFKNIFCNSPSVFYPF